MNQAYYFLQSFKERYYIDFPGVLGPFKFQSGCKGTNCFPLCKLFFNIFLMMFKQRFA